MIRQSLRQSIPFGQGLSNDRTIEEVQHIKHSYNLIQTYAQQRDLNRELVLWAQRRALICERKIGEMLLAMKERKELHCDIGSGSRSHLWLVGGASMFFH